MGFPSRDGNTESDQIVPEFQSDTENSCLSDRPRGHITTDSVATDGGHVAITSELAVNKDEMSQTPTSSVSRGPTVSTQSTDNDTVTAAQAECGSRAENETESTVTSGISQTDTGQPGRANDGENESSDSSGQRAGDDVTEDVMTSRDGVTSRRQLRSRFVVPVKRD